MKQKNKLLIAISFLLSETVSFAQVTIATNFSPPGTQFLGWNNLGFSKPLDIRNDFTQPIDFWTNSFRRMRITDGGNGNANGRIAMGNDLLPGFTPLSRLHLHQTAAVNAIRFTTDNMLGGNGFEVGYDATSAIQNRQYAVLNNRENTAMKFWTNNTQRMHINQSRQSQVATGIGGTNIYNIFTPGYVGIGRNNPGNNWGTQPL